MDLPSSDPPHSPIRHWQRSSTLGSGSFANVSLALDLDGGTLFAVKSPSSSSPSSPALLALQNELRILQTLRSPRVVRCLGSDAHRNLFLEYVTGGTVSDLIRSTGGHLDPPCLQRITHGVLEGLHYLHQRGIVHCDIKGRNLLLDSSTLSVKIADFGAAKCIDDQPSPSSAFRGTPLWMAPEVIQGLDQGPPSDIWSLGCTVVEMMQGRPPWALDSSNRELASLLFRIATEDPPLPEHASPLAKDFLSKCFQKDPARRWTAGELLKHPFLDDISCSTAELSPRSTLDFRGDHDWEDHSVERCSSSSKIAAEPPSSSPVQQNDHSSLPSHRASPPPPAPPTDQSSSKETDHPCSSGQNWIIVRRTEIGWPGDSFLQQPPSMKREADVFLCRPFVLKKGPEVSFECAAFLMKRRKVAV